MSKTEEIFKIGDLVKNTASKTCLFGIILKKRFSPDSINGQAFNVLTYDILLSDGDIKNLKHDCLVSIQKL